MRLSIIETQTNVTDMNDVATYLETCFRNTFPNATMIRVILDTSNETILVIVIEPTRATTVYEMNVSSDDDEYLFVSISDENDELEFPIQ